MKILVTGAAGYKGAALIPELLKQGHKVIGVDNLIFGPQPLLHLYMDKNFRFVKGDIRNYNLMKKLIMQVDGVIHLAAIVGFPACHKYPKMSKEINLTATKKMVRMKRNNQFFVFASTCSNYGARGTNKLCDENTILKPLSEYGVQKTQAEEYVRKFPNAVALRVATGFGVSPRFRYDLLVNDLTYKAIRDRDLTIYEGHHQRSFIHTKDIVDAYLLAIEKHREMSQQAYNVGGANLNLTKKEVTEIIQKETKCTVDYVNSGKDMDQRDYIVDFSKIEKFGFKCKVTMKEGVKQLKQVLTEFIKSGVLDSPISMTFVNANYSRIGLK